MKKKVIIGILITISFLVILYLLGPKPSDPKFDLALPHIEVDCNELDSYISKKESQYNIKPDNEARIIWANDTLKEQTEWVLLYLHGFSASWFEGSDLNLEFAEHFHCNAYFPRLSDHGIVTQDPLLNMLPDSLWNSAKEALVIAKKMGKKVMIMSTSTGGTLALKLAAEYPESVDGLILYSPNIKINAPTALLSKPWGLQLAKIIFGGNYRTVNEDFNSQECEYWYCKYRLEAVIYLQQLVEKTMTIESFHKVKSPVFLGYYYKDEKHQDQIVRVDAALKMFDQLGTPDHLKFKRAFPNAETHVIANSVFSKEIDHVKESTFEFANLIMQ